MRIDKMLSNLKYGSRNDIKSFLKLHDIKVNGNRIFNANFEINPNFDVIEIDSKKLYYKEVIDLMIYKPKGILSAHHDQMHPCIIDLLKEPYQRFDYAMAGRLDLDAEGLMILTTDGKFAHEITHPRYHLEKTYEVLLDKIFIHQLEIENGVWIKDGYNELFTAKARKVIVNEKHVTLCIDEGKFHQVKRMFKALGYEVEHLKRIAIGNLNLKDLKPGEYMEFEREELYDWHHFTNLSSTWWN